MPGQPWTDREDALVVEAARLNREVGELKEPSRYQQVADRTGRTYRAVVARAVTLGVRSRTGRGRKPRRWIGDLKRHTRIGEDA